MSKEKIKELKLLSGKCSRAKIHYSKSTSWSRNRDEGFNDALESVIQEINRRIKTLTK